MSDRGMKKWAPYSSLIEQSTCLEEMRFKKNKIEKPLISSDRANKINLILTSYHGQILKIKYYYDGYLYFIETPIKKIDTYKRNIIINDEIELPLKSIIDIDDDSIVDFDF